MTIVEFLNNALSNFLLLVSQSKVLQIVLGFWLLLAIFNQDHRRKLIDNLSFFLRMPLTYNETENTQYNNNQNNTPLYPRRIFLDIAKGLEHRIVEPFDSIFAGIVGIMKSLGGNLSLDVTLGGIVLSGFIYADIIGGINILSLVPGLISWNIPIWLSEYSITIIAGTILSVFISAWAWTTIDNSEDSINKIRRNIARFLLISTLVTILGINLSKLPVFVEGFSPGTIEFLDQVSGFFLHVMVMFNAALATFLLDKMGRSGLVILILPILFVLSVIFWITSFLLSIIAGFGPVTVDIIVRIIFIIMNIFVFYAIAPIDLGGNIFFRKKI